MIRRKEQAKVVEKQMFDGAGTAKMRLILETNEEMYQKISYALTLLMAGGDHNG